MTAYKPNELWNVDIFVMLAYKKSNDGFNYYLVAIDIFSRKAYGAKNEERGFGKCKRSNADNYN